MTLLYTNVDHESVLRTDEKEFANSTIKYGLKKPPNKYFIELLTITLENNHFEFEGTFWKQLIGVAMGSAHSPECSDITLFDLLKKFKSSL